MTRQFKGRLEQQRREHNADAWLAWHAAYLPNAKRQVPLRRLIVRDRRPQSADQMQKIAKQWTLSVGGRVEGKPN